MTFHRENCIVWAGILLSTAGGMLAQPVIAQETTFRSQSNVVLVPALVKDKSGNIVYELRSQDFVVEDDGVPQAVHLDEVAQQAPVSLVIAIECGRRSSYEFSRIQGLSSMLQPLLTQPESKVAIVEFDSQVHAVQDFTGNADSVSAALHGLQPGDGGAAILDAVNYSVKLLNQVRKNRQRVLLLISETRDHGSHSANVEQVLAALGDSNIVVYTLAFSPSKSNVLDTLRGRNNPDLHPDQTEVHEGPDLLAPIILAAQAMRKNTAKTVASMSGGEYEIFDSEKSFDARMTDFSNHLHNRYLLSFQPNNPHPGLHQLQLRLKEPQQVTILARKNYWAAAP